MSDRLEEVRPGIVWVGMRTVEGKAGVVAGSRAVLAIDAGIDLDEGRAVASAARSFDRESILLALTHAHTDHALGSPAFASQTVIVHNEAAEALRLILPADVAGWPPDLGGADMLGPTIWFSGDLEIDLGGRVVRLLDTPGHAPGAICAWVPDAGVLFGGDTIVTCIPPSFSDGDAVELAATLRTLASLGADVVVPGHGPVLTGVARIRTWLLGVADYIGRLIELAQNDRDGPSDDIDPAPYGSYLGHLLPETPELVERHHENIRCTRRQVADAERAS